MRGTGFFTVILIMVLTFIFGCTRPASEDPLTTKGGTVSGSVSVNSDNLPQFTKIFVAQWVGTPCIDAIRWHWGMGEEDKTDKVEGTNLATDECNRSFTKQHTFLTGARRQVWAVFLRDDEEIGQTDPMWVRP
jgi:hypothetical protein